ncbi:esterase E4-like [Planococcus citri]|uniref:esterase E4-like n=1 Tax=Planococcus citri TaxID=170843 RepID=UPI0031F8B6BB
MSERIIVSLKEGKIRGVKKISEYSGAEYYSFYGVPYGQPPVNNLRFKDPVKVKTWKDVYDATIEKPGCIQFSLKLYRFLGNEDCLFNNIHTPELPTKSTPLRPVIVLIHPGSFHHGSPNEDNFGNTSFVMHRDIVYVGIAYRLHLLGFLNLGIKECSGNQGIKDIILSLHWIKDNISSFGGDPENVTLIGSSNEAVIIHILMLSPTVQDAGIFHKAVIMGGNLFDPTAYFQNANEKDALEIAEKAGYRGDISDMKKLLLFFKKVNIVALIEAHRKLQKDFHKKVAPVLPTGIFLPTIDHGENAVLPIFPRELIPKTSKIPLIIGYCDLESALGFVPGFIRTSTMKNIRTTIRQNKWGWGRDLSDEDLELINKEIESFYLQGEPIEKAPISTLIDIQTGAIISDIYDTLINVVASTAAESPVYLYRFQFEGDMGTLKNRFIGVFKETIKGTFHADDACYWGCIDEPPNEKAKHTVETFTKLISTFARTGDPNFKGIPVHWRPTRSGSPCYLSINNDLEMVDNRLHNEKLEFWDKIKKRFQKNTVSEK